MVFYYTRWHNVARRLVPLEQDMDNLGQDTLVSIDIWYCNNLIFNKAIRGNCNLVQVIEDLLHEDIELPLKA